MSRARQSIQVPRIEAWSIEQSASESEFLRREIGLDIRVAPIDEIAAHAAQRSVLVVVSEAGPYVDLVEQAPPGSLVLFMISDEGYSPERFHLVENASSIRAIFRQYAIDPASVADIVTSSWGFLRAASSTSVNVRVLPHLLATGWRTRRRMNRWRGLSVPVRSVPLGYTTDFARALIDDLNLDIGPDVSLVEAAFSSVGTRDVATVFRGSPGNAHRQALVEYASRQPDSAVSWVDADWTATPPQQRASQYVQSLRRARRALCPPGAVNTETFRFYEAVMCGADPLEPRTALTHWGRPTARGTDPRELIRLALRDIRVDLADALADRRGGERS